MNTAPSTTAIATENDAEIPFHNTPAPEMTSKDVVMDLFGDYIRYMGDSIRLGQLTQVMALFGVEAATVRVAVSRMRREGWVSTLKEGRNTAYTPTDKMRAVLDDGRERIFNAAPEPWSGHWTMVLYQIPESRRRWREYLKRTLNWEGFGQLNPTTWISPRDIRDHVRTLVSVMNEENVHVFTMNTGDRAEDERLARHCWDLSSLAEDYQRFIRTWAPLTEAPARELSPAEALVQRVSLIWDYRQFPFKDPGLPAELAPAGWPAPEAHEVFLRGHENIASAATEYMSTLLSKDAGDAING